MNSLYKKAGSFLLLLCAGIFLTAQTLPYKTLSLELQTLQKQLVPDRRVAILNFELKDTLQLFVVVAGETDQPEAKEQISRFLNEKGVSYIDSIRLLPDSLLGAQTWALASLSVSNMRSQPDDASELVSQALMGTPMKVLDQKGGWYRVQTPEHYIGWMYSGELQRFTPSEMDRWKKSGRYFFNRISGCLYSSSGKKGEVVSDLVFGDIFEVEAEIKGFLRIKIPDGRTGYVRKADCLSWKEWSTCKPDVLPVISVARQMMGFPYLWGGASSKAADCSGLVKLVYFSQGIILARDASQQAKYGEPVDFSSRDNLQPGDLLFFGRSAQRISHVGIYLGGGNFIHSSGRVHISSIDPNDPKYVATRKNVAACRILSSLNTDGIAAVKNHPWYSVQP